jgi:uncharacterized protein (DUF302 family)
MRSAILFFQLLGVLVATTALQAAEPVDVSTPHARIWRVEGEVETLQQYVKDAIVNRGLKVTEGDIGLMLDRTAEGVGAGDDLFSEARFLQFCSATLSREAMAADPANMAFCPFTVFVYATAESPKEVHLGYRRLPLDGDAATQATMRKIDALLTQIVEEALE